MLVSNTPFLELARMYWTKDFNTFPSDNIGLYRYQANNRADYYNYVLTQLATRADAYYPFYVPVVTKFWEEEKKRAVVVDKIFLDVDMEENIPTAWEKGQLFYSVFWENIELYFSGSKGFHTKVYINPTTFGELHDQRERLYDVFCTWFQLLLDKKAFISLDRICRITLTKHRGLPERWKIPIEPKMELPEIFRRSQYPRLYVHEFENLYWRRPKPLDWKLFLKSPHTLLNL